MVAPRLTIRSVDIRERRMPFARPFRFGSSIVEAAPQAFARVVVEVEGHGTATGLSAEMMMPKWFDKDPDKSPAQTIDDLRRILLHAAALYDGQGPDTAFGLSAGLGQRQADWAGSRKLPLLAAQFGPALLDKAVLDALLRATGLSFLQGLTRNVMGLDPRLTPALAMADIEDLISALTPAPSVALRHTIGLMDPLDGPDGLAGEIQSAQLRFFKIKIGGDLGSDLARLGQITRILSAEAPGFRATLDANEQYDPDRLVALAHALGASALAPLRAALLYVEQPYDRRETFSAPLPAALGDLAVIIDEADAGYESFEWARALGYRGVSSKACKGLYKSILNAARVRALNASGAAVFLSAEDLTCQPGLGIEQDTALVAALGLTHGERNGHHYVDGFGPAPEAEARAFAAAHPELYRDIGGRIRLDVSRGALPAISLFRARGFARAAEPDWASLSPILPSPSFIQETSP